MRTRAVKYLGPLPRGSSRPVRVEADDGGIYVLKTRSAGQGVKTLVAEVIATGLARAIGLLAPDLAIVDFDPALAQGEIDGELRESLARSPGDNLGIDWLPGARLVDPRIDADIRRAPASLIVWLDALIQNVDRTPKNPNLLSWHRRIWVFDHGVAFPFHFGDDDPRAAARERCPDLEGHVLLGAAGDLEEADAAARRRLEGALERIVGAVPEAWIDAASPPTPRAAYVAYLEERLARSSEFVRELGAARGNLRA
ncbi:MAG: aminotransferase class I and II [Labilithrix sp.]|nr:aminotransferase class I and II [Labilithrix sp.]